ncbi:hypothetical protein G9272_16830 [Streptomyces asoensis]|uniref:Lsr2 DNA-binding domain-containing protein n=1 Tax=Streptomyces asoensis TaxID=249586 RepID=A0A6M4WMI9_9ACTN|nr:histone-like nucleoid-structuring protein Lsr2 [Streptomyces asoensis]QJT01770.1 hypothetical protein G9272_16830 [Streptomyces asoensis]
MTVRALLSLLDEIDREGGPDAARNNRLHLLSERTSPMTTAPATQHQTAAALTAVPRAAGPAQPQPPSVGQLLAWADNHTDEEIRDQSSRARLALAGLRRRYDTDKELTEIGTEAERLEQRLAEIRAREAELAPAKQKKARTPVDYPAAEVRAWAAEAGMPCSPTGRVPKAVVDAWRAREQ